MATVLHTIGNPTGRDLGSRCRIGCLAPASGSADPRIRGARKRHVASLEPRDVGAHPDDHVGRNEGVLGGSSAAPAAAGSCVWSMAGAFGCPISQSSLFLLSSSAGG